METSSRPGTWAMWSGFAAIILGLAHLITTPLFYPLYDLLDRHPRQIFLYVFLSTGLALIAAGLLLVNCASFLKQGLSWAWRIALGASGFITAIGVLAVIAMSRNAIAFLSLLTGLAGLVPLLVSGKEFTRGRHPKKRH